MKFRHINIVARDADQLAAFYEKIFNCQDLRSRRTLSGENVSRGNGLPNSSLYSIWLTLPGVEGPFLEIHQHENAAVRRVPVINEPGYGHLSFEVEDLQATFEEIIQAGGSKLGDITNFATDENPVLIVYMRDPDGNILELEQR